jgi:CheY-like chemotaxis protein
MAKKILIIDDDSQVTTYLKTLLKDNSYEVVTAQNGNEGLEKAKKEKPDAISLDLLMPEKTGIKLYRELRNDKALKCIPIIIVTGIASQCQAFAEFKTFIAKRKVQGPEAYLEKPINQDEYLAKVKEALR